ncbi:hypothetical protein GOB85_04720 [Acetobacter sp. LMG 1636]|nr:hypothetical protein [Acetobacter fallax]
MLAVQPLVLKEEPVRRASEFHKGLSGCVLTEEGCHQPGRTLIPCGPAFVRILHCCEMLVDDLLFDG